MSERGYIFLRATYARPEQVAQTLEEMPGVVMADPVDGGPPDVIVVVEGADLFELTELSIKAVSSVETVAWFLSWLRVRSKDRAARDKGDFENPDGHDVLDCWHVMTIRATCVSPSAHVFEVAGKLRSGAYLEIQH